MVPIVLVRDAGEKASVGRINPEALDVAHSSGPVLPSELAKWLNVEHVSRSGRVKVAVPSSDRIVFDEPFRTSTESQPAQESTELKVTASTN